jgi:hypothetical protein
MTISRSEDLLVGIIAAAVVPWTIWTIMRGLREGKLPIGRGHVRRNERAAPFAVLLALYAVGAAMAAYIAVDLLFGLSS